MRLYAVLLAISLFAEPAQAMTDYYVSKTSPVGNDANSGLSLAAAKLTIAGGAAAMSGSDRLFINDGTYNERYLTFPGGSPGAHTIVQAINRNAVIVRPSTTTGFDAVFWQLQSYVTLDGMDADASLVGGIPYYANENVHHLTFQNGTARGARGSGFSSPASGVDLSGSYPGGNIVRNMDLIDNGSPVSDAWSNLDHQIYLVGSNNLIENNRIRDSLAQGEAITVHDVTQTVTGNIIRNNRIFDNVGIGIVLSESINGLDVYNNLIYDNGGQGVYTYNGTISGVRILFNTITGNGAAAVLITGGSTGTVVRNNIFWANGFDGVTDSGVGTFQSNNITADPQFTDAGSDDFTLEEDSPAIAAAVAVSGIESDIVALLRLEETASGAYEFGSVEVVEPEPEPEPVDPEEPEPEPEVPPGEVEPVDPEVFPVLTNIIDSFDSVRFENKIHAVTQERTSGRVGYHVFNMATKLWEIVNQEVVASNSDGDIGVTICVRSNGEPCIAFRGDREAGGPSTYHGMVIAPAGDYRRCYVTRLVDDVWTTPAMIGSPNDLTATFFPFGTLYNGAVNVRMGRAIAEADDWVRFVFTVEEPADVASTPDLYTQLLRPDNDLTLAHEFEFTGGLGYTAACVVGDPCVFQYAGDWYTAVPIGLLIYPSIYIWQGTGTLGDATFEIPLVDSTTGVQTMPDTYTTLNPPIGVRWFKDKLYVVMGTRQGSTADWAVLKTISPPFSAVDPDALSAPRGEQVGPTWPNATYARHGVEFATIRGKDYLFKCTTGNFGVPGSAAKSILEKIDLDADVPGDNGYLLAEWLADNG